MPSIEFIIETGNISGSNLGYQIYDRDYPTPLPTSNQVGFFGPLFGIMFQDQATNQQLVRAIAIAEYVTTFGYAPSFNTAVCQTLHNPCLLQQMIPARTMSAVADMLQELVHIPSVTSLTNQSERYDLDLSVSALFNGVISTNLPQDDDWSRAYMSNDNC
jgi:hypothetical protein